MEWENLDWISKSIYRAGLVKYGHIEPTEGDDDDEPPLEDLAERGITVRRK